MFGKSTLLISQIIHTFRQKHFLITIRMESKKAVLVLYLFHDSFMSSLTLLYMRDLHAQCYKPLLNTKSQLPWGHIIHYIDIHLEFYAFHSFCFHDHCD